MIEDFEGWRGELRTDRVSTTDEGIASVEGVDAEAVVVFNLVSLRVAARFRLRSVVVDDEEEWSVSSERKDRSDGEMKSF